MLECLSFPQLHLTQPQDFYNNVLYTDGIKVEIFGHNAQN